MKADRIGERLPRFRFRFRFSFGIASLEAGTDGDEPTVFVFFNDDRKLVVRQLELRSGPSERNSGVAVTHSS